MTAGANHLLDWPETLDVSGEVQPWQTAYLAHRGTRAARVTPSASTQE